MDWWCVFTLDRQKALHRDPTKQRLVIRGKVCLSDHGSPGKLALGFLGWDHVRCRRSRAIYFFAQLITEMQQCFCLSNH